MTRNILLTTLGNTFDHNRHYYYSYTGNGETKYCEGISTAEAGSKYILSRVPVDKIIVLGPLSACKDENIEKEIMLRDLCIFGAALPERYSEYMFYCYRIMQFLNQIDIEGADLLDELSEEEQKSVTDEMKKHYPSSEFKNLFHQFDGNLDLYEEFLDKLPQMDKRKRRWLKHYLFMRMERDRRMKTLGANEDITVQFVPTIRKDEGNIHLGNLPGILNYILDDGKSDVNIYVDLQGLDIGDSHTLINVLFILQNEKKKKISIQEIITTTYRSALFTNPIEDQKDRLELSELLAGLNAFLQYGKVDSIRDYWLSRNIEDEHIDRLIFAMQTVDIGISLCSVSELEQGIRLLREVFAEKRTSSESTESVIFNIMGAGIRQDYGSLLKSNEINVFALIKWAMKKHFYQQALTIIESRVPYDLVRSGVFYYARSEEERQEFMKRLNEVFWKSPAKDRYQFDHMEHYFIKFYRRREAYNKRTDDALGTYIEMRMDEIFDPASEIHSYTKSNSKRAVFTEFMKSYLQIGNIRNNISHAQEMGTLEASKSLRQRNEKIALLEDSIQEFMRLYELVKTGTSPKNPNQFMVSAEEFYIYRNEHRLRN